MSEQAITKLRVKLGAAEIDYEGGTDFLKEEVMPTIGKILEMVQDRTDLQKVPAVVVPEPVARIPLASVSGQSKSTNTIATLLHAKSGGDVATAAAAKLTIYDGKETISRGDILQEMQTAISFYNINMAKNLSNILKQLAKEDRLRLVAKDTYALAQKERQTLEQKLAEAG